MAVFQVFGLDQTRPLHFVTLCNTTDLALYATKTTAQAIGRAMASLVVVLK